jgi:hypothetical protein
MSLAKVDAASGDGGRRSRPHARWRLPTSANRSSGRLSATATLGLVKFQNAARIGERRARCRRFTTGDTALISARLRGASAVLASDPRTGERFPPHLTFVPFLQIVRYLGSACAHVGI